MKRPGRSSCRRGARWWRVTAIFRLRPLRPAAPRCRPATVQRGDFERWVTADGALRAAAPTLVRGAARRPRAGCASPGSPPRAAASRRARWRCASIPTEIETHPGRPPGRPRGQRAEAREAGRRGRPPGSRTWSRDAELAERDLEHCREFATQRRGHLLALRDPRVPHRPGAGRGAPRVAPGTASRARGGRSPQSDRELLAIERRKISADVDRAETTLSTPWRSAPPTRASSSISRTGAASSRGSATRSSGRRRSAELPQLGEMEVEAYVLEADAGGLEVGDRGPGPPGGPPRDGLRRRGARGRQHRQAPPPGLAGAVLRGRLRLAETDPELMKPGQRVRAEIFLEKRAGRPDRAPAGGLRRATRASVVYRLSGSALRAGGGDDRRRRTRARGGHRRPRRGGPDRPRRPHGEAEKRPRRGAGRGADAAGPRRPAGTGRWRWPPRGPLLSPAEAVGSALGSLGSHKLRSALTMLGMIFGVGAVIAMLSIGDGRRAAGAVDDRAPGAAQRPGAGHGLSSTDLQEARKKSLGVSPPRRRRHRAGGARRGDDRARGSRSTPTRCYRRRRQVARPRSSASPTGTRAPRPGAGRGALLRRRRRGRPRSRWR